MGHVPSKRYTFRGFTTSILSWDQGNAQWNLNLYGKPNTYAFCNESGIDYPFGSKIWYFVNDSCSQEIVLPTNEYPRYISFSACTVEEFTCNDGTW